MKTSLLLLFAVAALAACQSPQKPKRERPPELNRTVREFKSTHQSTLTPEQRKLVVATVGKKKITLGDLERHLNRQPLYIRARYSTLKQKKQLLRDLAQFEALAMEAQLKGYDQHPDVLQYQKRLMVSKLLQNELKEKLKITDISDADAKTYYDGHLEEFNQEAKVRISHLLSKSKEQAEKILAEIKADVGKYRYRTHRVFQKLARKHSVDAKTKPHGGDLGYFTVSGPAKGNTHKIPRVLLVEAFKMKRVNDLAGPIKSDQGWHVLLLSHQRPRIARPFASVKRYIQSRLFRQKRLEMRRDFIEGLKKAAKIEISDKNLSLLKVSTVKSFQPHMHRLRQPSGKPLQLRGPNRLRLDTPKEPSK